jgi:hypothetical protein
MDWIDLTRERDDLRVPYNVEKFLSRDWQLLKKDSAACLPEVR